jgi:uncharacterized damage-inducible protein DinB
VVDDLSDRRRIEPPFVLPERAMLESWLEFHRITLLMKCDGLDDTDRKRRPIATSLLSLHGLLRHMTDVEQNWFRKVLAGDTSPSHYRGVDGRGDGDWTDSDGADWDHDVAAWQAECDASRAIARDRELDDVGMRRGEPCSLRWIYLHMIEEYARHNGHADLVRELIDGSVGL